MPTSVVVRGDIDWMRRHREWIRKRVRWIVGAHRVRLGVLRVGARRLEFLVLRRPDAHARWTRSAIRERSLFFENIFQQSSWTGTHQTWRE